MLLTGQKITRLNTIAHEGKVLIVGTNDQGVLYYTVKKSGFEDTALDPDKASGGFEDWKKLPLDRSTHDASVIAKQKKDLADKNDNPLLTCRYGTADATVESACHPVQLISGLGHLYVFRVATDNKLLVNRFVLDGMKNELVPKLEVRFRRSKQKFNSGNNVKANDAGKGSGADADTLDFRDMQGNPFYEPALELSFAGALKEGRFAPVLLPTAEHERFRWNIFVHDNSTNKIILYSVRASTDGLFDIRDYSFAQPNTNGKITYRIIPGIIERTIDISGYAASEGLAAANYDLQIERLTESGMQLMRDSTRVMLAVPVSDGSTETVAALSFAAGSDGTLSQIDTTPSSDLVRSNSRDILLPLNTLDEIKEVADSTPTPSGTIEAMERGDKDRLTIKSKTSLPSGLLTGNQVNLSGTKSYDGHYKVLAVSGNTFTIEAEFKNAEPGFWEKEEETNTGLIFDNMIVGYEKTATDRLTIECSGHDLKAGDEVQVTGTKGRDGIYPVKSVDKNSDSFDLDIDFQPGN